MRIFERPAAMLGEVTAMQKAEKNRREDRATVSSFFNGAPPISQAEAEELGLTVNVNNLFGYTDIRNLRDQVVALHTKPARMIEIQIDSAPNGKRLDWEMKAQQAASEVLRQYRPFKTDYVGVAGDAGLHGEAVFFYGTRTFPLPRQVPLSRMLVPDGASTDTSSLTHFAIEDTLKPRDLEAAYTHKYKDWNRANVRKVLDSIYKDIRDQASDEQSDNFEELEYRAQENSASAKRKTGVPVIYFFQQRPDEDGPPYDLTILLKRGGDGASKDDVPADRVLFERKKMYPKISSILHPFFMDCILGGAPTWHRVMGTGTLNYQLNIATEMLINRAMQATWEGSMNLWKASNGATREEIQRVLVRHNGVIPENMELVQNRFAPNFTGMLEMIQYFRMQGGRNARGAALNQGNNSADVLEVQAIADQNRAASENANAAGEWHDFYDGMLDEALARLANPFIMPNQPGYSMVKDFQDRMEREDIPLYWLQPHNVKAKAVRILGDGIPAKELAASTVLSNNRQFFPPESQPTVTRLIVALGTGNYRLAEDLVPIQQKPDSSQILRAQTENAIMVTGSEAVGREADDIDEIHAPVHFKGLEGIITAAMQSEGSAFTPQQAVSFKSIGGHILVHIKTIEGKSEPNKNDANRQLSRALTDQLNQYAAIGDKLMNNMQQKQQAGQKEQMTPAEQAKIQLSFQQLQLQREKMTFSMEKFARQQGNREQTQAFTQMMQMEADHREGNRLALDTRSAEHDKRLREIEVATKVAQANKPEPAPTA